MQPVLAALAGVGADDAVGQVIAVIGLRRAGPRPRAHTDRARTEDGPIAGETQGQGVRDAALADCLARARAGDGDAFGELVRRYEPDVTRLCRRILGAGEEARDAAQESFARAHAALESYDPERPFRRWLLAVAAHRAVDALRRRRREAQIFAGEAFDADFHAEPGPSPLQHGLSAERRNALLAAIESLPDPYRTALVLRYFADQEIEAIAEILAVSRNQVATLLFRGRRRLRTALAEETP